MMRLLRAIAFCTLALGAGFGLASRAEAPEPAEPTRLASSDDPGVRALLDTTAHAGGYSPSPGRSCEPAHRSRHPS